MKKLFVSFIPPRAQPADKTDWGSWCGKEMKFY